MVFLSNFKKPVYIYTGWSRKSGHTLQTSITFPLFALRTQIFFCWEALSKLSFTKESSGSYGNLFSRYSINSKTMFKNQFTWMVQVVQKKVATPKKRHNFPSVCIIDLNFFLLESPIQALFNQRKIKILG
jgi:hypothetical protein